jgi:predicted secreted protein
LAWRFSRFALRTWTAITDTTSKLVGPPTEFSGRLADQGSDMLTLDDSAAGQAVNLAVGQVIELRLAENPTTGFVWSVVRDGAPACAVVGQAFVAAQGGVPGQGGRKTWHIEGRRAGDCDILLVNRRPFEPHGAQRDFVLHVRVAP